MMIKALSTRLLLSLAFAAQTPSLASACGGGGDKILFTEAPPPTSFPSAETIRVHFTNVGPHFDKWRKQPPLGEWPGHLIGVARVVNAKHVERRDYFPVFASVSSCTHGFWSMVAGNPDHRVWNGEYYLVGRFLSEKAGFRAGGNEDGKWHD